MSAPDQTIKFKNYQSLDLTNKIYQLKAVRLINELPLPQNPKVLELGSADDSFLNLICQQTSGLGTGLDITKGDDFEKPLKLKSNAFDLAISLEVIEHLYDTDLHLTEICRCLKKGGFLVLSTPNLASLTNRLKLLIGRYPKYLEYSNEGAGHLHLYTPKVLKSQLQKHGFKIRTFTSPNFLNPFITKKILPSFLKEISLVLGDLLPNLGSHLLVVAQKQ